MIYLRYLLCPGKRTNLGRDEHTNQRKYWRLYLGRYPWGFWAKELNAHLLHLKTLNTEEHTLAAPADVTAAYFVSSAFVELGHVCSFVSDCFVGSGSR